MVIVTSRAASKTAEQSATTISAVCSFVRWSSGAVPSIGFGGGGPDGPDGAAVVEFAIAVFVFVASGSPDDKGCAAVE